jgi:hypothetical protein
MSNELRPALAASAVTPLIGSATSRHIADALAELAAGVEASQLRYYFAAGGIRPLWSARRTTAPELHRPTLARVEDVLHSRELREAAVARELDAVDEWLDQQTGQPKWLVAELLGSVDSDNVAFLRACGQRLAGRARLVVLRHAAPDRTSIVAGQADEVLCSLLLAGGWSTASNINRWAALRGWSSATLELVTRVRSGFVSIAGSDAWRQARSAGRRLGPPVVAALASMVVGDEESPLLTSAALADDPAVVAQAIRGEAAAYTARHQHTLLEYGRAALYGSRRGPSGPAGATYSYYLAGLVAAQGSRLSPAAADRVLRLAEHSGVQADVRSLLSYHLGQLMAKSTDSRRWPLSIRYFDYSLRCLDGSPSNRTSRMAACYNGEALARYRTGDRAGAIRAEQAGLQALAQAGAGDDSTRLEQRTLLLANLADVYARDTSTVLDAIRCGRRAVRTAQHAGSAAALSYVVPNQVKRLIGQGWLPEAERVTRLLLADFDNRPARRRLAERAVVGTCCRLASAYADDDPTRAAVWYGEAADRLHCAAPEALSALLRQLRTDGVPRALAPTMARLDAELADRLTARAQLQPLLALLDQR